MDFRWGAFTYYKGEKTTHKKGCKTIISYEILCTKTGEKAPQLHPFSNPQEERENSWARLESAKTPSQKYLIIL